MRTYEEHMAAKKICSEHTKELFNENQILCLHNLYVLRTFMELFKILKYHCPVSIFSLFTVSPTTSTWSAFGHVKGKLCLQVVFDLEQTVEHSVQQVCPQR